MDIRKISVGPDYKTAMHYIVGQEVVAAKCDNGEARHTIHLIKYDESRCSIKIWIQHMDEIFLWKEFTSSVPISIEYNISF